VDVTGKEYQEHRVFKELAGYADFYRHLSTCVMTFLSQGTRGILNIDTYSFSSMEGTQGSIALTLAAGRINDAFALVRKYHDSVMVNVYTSLYLQDNFSIENFVVEKIDNWIQGKEKLPEYRVMSQYVRKSEKVRHITDLLHVDDRYKKIRDRCNDHAHYNFYRHVMLNDRDIHNPHRLKWLNRLSADVQDLFILHFAYAFSLNEAYMMSSDYIDALDCNMHPEEGSQYWVAPFVQEMLDGVMKPRRPDIYAALKEGSSMQLA
jgi:hypothetical protein